MHTIQTSSSCIRNITSDPLVSMSRDEIADVRPLWRKIICQQSCLHPEYAYLPHKFKITVTGSYENRVVEAVHDIGLRIVHNQ